MKYISLYNFNYLKMKEIEWGSVQTVCLNSLVRCKNNQFVQDHYYHKDYNLLYIKCTLQMYYTLLGAYIILINISENIDFTLI